MASTSTSGASTSLPLYLHLEKSCCFEEAVVFNLFPFGQASTQHDIIVTVSAAKPTSLTLRLAYVVKQASWKASYDVRVLSYACLETSLV